MMGMHQPNRSVHQNNVNATDAIGDGSLSMTCATHSSIRFLFKVGWVFTFAAAAYNLVRMRNLATQAT